MFSNKLSNFFCFLIIFIYLLFSFFKIKDYGITIDEAPAFGLGHKYLHYYKTGETDLLSREPQIDNHPNFYSYYVKEYNDNLWLFTSTLSALTCYLFFEKLNYLDPISAHNIFIPILTALLLLFLYFFLKKYFNNFIALISILILITMPQFFGQTFNNLRDIPEILFFSITIISFAYYYIENKIIYLYLSFIFWGVSIVTKMDGLLIPIIIFLWIAKDIFLKFKKDSLIRIRIILHLILGFLLMVLLSIIILPPLQPFFYLNFKEYIKYIPKYLYATTYYAFAIGGNLKSSWNLYSIKQIIITTPILVLIFLIIGLIFMFINIKNNKLYLLFLIWALFPVLRHCLPRVNHYDGLRHFLIFLVPMSFIVAIGIDWLVKKISNYLKLKKFIIFIILFSIVITPNIYALIKTHPYQTTFYNCLVGGLKGVQGKDIPFSCDYWLNSTRKTVEWLNLKASKDALVTQTYCNLLQFYKPNYLRPDLNVINYNKSNIKSGTYIIHIPRKLSRLDEVIYNKIEEIIPDINNLKLVYRITSQGGEICSIYYKE